jgi:hypothetical protein
MEAVISLLDVQHEWLVEALWAELADTFGLRGVSITPYAHFSYQIAQRYAVADLEPVVRRVAAATAPFTVETAGLGIFTGAQPVLYLPVARGPALARLQATLWRELAGTGTGVSDYYHPARWIPHITIAFGDTTPATLAAVTAHLSGRDLAWRITIDNLASIQVADGRQVLGVRQPLTGPPPAAAEDG